MQSRALSRILVVEDDPDIQALSSLALTKLGGFAVEMCSSGPQALAAAPAFAPDLILLDVMMPGMDGADTLAALRRVPQTADTPVVFMTARIQPHEVARYREMGCLDVIVKPFVPSKLPEILRSLWSRREVTAPCALVGEIRDSGEIPDSRARIDDLADLRDVYRAEVPDRLRALEETARAACERGDAAGLEEFSILAHRLVGSSALYGLTAVSEAARQLEDLARALRDDASTPGTARMTELERLLKALWKSWEGHRPS